MKNVGQSNIRNEEFKKLFSRERLIQHLVANEYPVIFDIGINVERLTILSDADVGDMVNPTKRDPPVALVAISCIKHILLRFFDEQVAVFLQIDLYIDEFPMKWIFCKYALRDK